MERASATGKPTKLAATAATVWKCSTCDPPIYDATCKFTRRGRHLKCKAQVRRRECFRTQSACDGTDEDGALSSSMMNKAKSTLVKERPWRQSCGQRAVCFSFLQALTLAPLHEERSEAAVREETGACTSNSTCRVVTDGRQSPWKLLVEKVSKSSQEVITVAKRIREHIAACTWSWVSFQEANERSVITMRLDGLPNEEFASLQVPTCVEVTDAKQVHCMKTALASEQTHARLREGEKAW